MEARNVIDDEESEEDSESEEEEIEEDSESEEEEIEEDFFLKLFYEAFKRRRPIGIASDENIRKSIYKIVEFFKENRSPAGVCAHDRFLRIEDRLGYFYYYSPLSAAVTRFKTLNGIQNCEPFRLFFRRPSLKIVSVGGGTGSDLVGLFSALNGNSAIGKIELVLIENNKKWKPYFQVVERLLRNRNTDFGNASKFVTNTRIATSFVCADMTSDELTLECVKAFGRANLVWMKGFLSTLRNDYERHCITDKIISLMKRGALLVVMESLAYDQFETFVEERKLMRLYNTNNGYLLRLNSQPVYRIIRSAKVEMIIFLKI